MTKRIERAIEHALLRIPGQDSRDGETALSLGEEEFSLPTDEAMTTEHSIKLKNARSDGDEAKKTTKVLPGKEGEMFKENNWRKTIK